VVALFRTPYIGDVDAAQGGHVKQQLEEEGEGEQGDLHTPWHPRTRSSTRQQGQRSICAGLRRGQGMRLHTPQSALQDGLLEGRREGPHAQGAGH